MTLVGLLVALIVFCLMVWAVQRIIAGFAIPDPLATVIYVALVVVLVLSLLSWAQLLPTPGLRLR